MTRRPNRRMLFSARGGPLCALTAIIAMSLGSVRAQTVWTLTTADFRTEAVLLRALDAGGLRVSSPGAANNERLIPFDRFLQLERPAAASHARPASRFLAILSDGDRLSGEPVATEAGDIVLWASRALGQTRLPLGRLTAIVRAGVELGDPSLFDVGTRRAEDLLFLVNGDSVSGIVTDVSAAKVSVQPSSGGEVTDIPLDTVLALLFASAAPSRPGVQPGTEALPMFRVRLLDGSAISVEMPQLEGESLKLTRGANQTESDGRRAGGGAPTVIPCDTVASIEQVNGPVVWLSSLAPTENIHTPFLDLSWPARMDSAVDAGPLRFGDRTYLRGIGVHSYSRLSFPVDGSMKAFRTQYALADAAQGDAPFADVTVRVKLDGKIAFERTHVRAGELSPVLQLETGGARTLTLEVDYGSNQDVQDRFNWIEPALLRQP